MILSKCFRCHCCCLSRFAVCVTYRFVSGFINCSHWTCLHPLRGLTPTSSSASASASMSTSTRAELWLQEEKQDGSLSKQGINFHVGPADTTRGWMGAKSVENSRSLPPLLLLLFFASLLLLRIKQHVSTHSQRQPKWYMRGDKHIDMLKTFSWLWVVRYECSRAPKWKYSKFTLNIQFHSQAAAQVHVRFNMQLKTDMST